MLFDDRLAGSFLLYLLVEVSAHIAFHDHCNEGIEIPERISVHPTGIIWLIAWRASGARVAGIGSRKGAVEVDKGHLDWPVQRQDDVLRLEVSVHEP